MTKYIKSFLFFTFRIFRKKKEKHSYHFHLRPLRGILSSWRVRELPDAPYHPWLHGAGRRYHPRRRNRRPSEGTGIVLPGREFSIDASAGKVFVEFSQPRKTEYKFRAVLHHLRPKTSAPGRKTHRVLMFSNIVSSRLRSLHTSTFFCYARSSRRR